MDLGLAGRGAAVAAGSDGLGLACAAALAAEGADVSICGRDAERLERAAALIREQSGGRVLSRVADVSQRRECHAFVEGTATALGRLDILITNTGGPSPGRFEDLGDAAWEEALRSSLDNVIHLVRAAVPHMRKPGWGRIVNIASLTAREPADGMVLSNTIRPAILGLSKTLAKELGGHGILVNTVCPGYMSTARFEDVARRRPGQAESLKSQIPLGRLGDPREFASVVAFLCSEKASYVTGTALLVDGGLTRGIW